MEGENHPNGDDRKVVISKIEKKSERVRYIFFR
jgi:hypothetical protein